MDTASKTIFFHVGTSKTGSTFLQNRIFPLLKGIAYIPTNKYHNIYTEIKKIKQKSILVSREFDRQFEDEIEKFYDELASFYGKIYLAKDLTLGKKNFRKMYPESLEWEKIVKEIDPKTLISHNYQIG